MPHHLGIMFLTLSGTQSLENPTRKESFWERWVECHSCSSHDYDGGGDDDVVGTGQTTKRWG